MYKAAYLTIIFTVGLWTGGIFAPNQTPAADDRFAFFQPANQPGQHELLVPPAESALTIP